MTENNNASVFSENSSFVLYFSATEKIICNYSLPYKIFRFFNEKSFPHCVATHTTTFESEWKAVLDDAEYVNLLQFSSPGEPLFFSIGTQRSVQHKLDFVDWVQIKTTKAADDFDWSYFWRL